MSFLGFVFTAGCMGLAVWMNLMFPVPHMWLEGPEPGRNLVNFTWFSECCNCPIAISTLVPQGRLEASKFRTENGIMLPVLPGLPGVHLLTSLLTGLFRSSLSPAYNMAVAGLPAYSVSPCGFSKDQFFPGTYFYFFFQ